MTLTVNLPLIPLVLLILVANLTSVSTSPVAKCHRYQWHQWKICHRCQRHRRQIMGTTSDWLHLKMNLKIKNYLYVNFTTQRCPNKIFKTFLIKGFFHLPLEEKCLELRISKLIFEKFETALGPSGNWFMKKPEVENPVALSLQAFNSKLCYSLRWTKVVICPIYWTGTTRWVPPPCFSLVDGTGAG